MLCFLNFCSLSRTRRRYIGLKKSCLVIYRVSFWSSLTFDTWVSMCTLKAKGKKIICNRQSISFLHLTVISYQLHPIKWERIIKNKTLPTKQRFNSAFPYYTPGRWQSRTGRFSRVAKKKNVSLSLISKGEFQKIGWEFFSFVPERHFIFLFSNHQKSHSSVNWFWEYSINAKWHSSMAVHWQGTV